MCGCNRVYESYPEPRYAVQLVNRSPDHPGDEVRREIVGETAVEWIVREGARGGTLIRKDVVVRVES